MSNSRALKIISYLSKAVSLEEEIFDEEDQEYSAIFSKDFALENEFLRDMQMLKSEQDFLNEHHKNAALKPKTLKSIHKKLAAKTHPDLKEGDEEEFKKIQKAYEEENTSVLVSYAVDYDVDVEIEDDEVKSLMTDIQFRKAKLEQRKNTIRWHWGSSNKDPEVRKQIRKAMQIEDTIFDEWLKNRKS